MTAGLKGKIMENLSMAAGIGSQIGALELGDHLTDYSDGVLEAAALASTGPTQVKCTQIHVNCAGDGMLEAAVRVSSGPTKVNCTQGHIHCAGAPGILEGVAKTP